MTTKIDLKKIRKKAKNLPFLLARYGFFVFLIIFFVIFGLGLVFLREKSSFLPEIPKEELIIFQRKIYQQVVKEIEEREKRFLETEKKSYPDIFQGGLTK